MDKIREKEILLMIYKESENKISTLNDEKPDFLLFNYLKSFLFGVEVTEIYNNESSARLKRKPGYLDQLIDKRKYSHKDDKSFLIVDEISLLDSDGKIKLTTFGILQEVPTIETYLKIVTDSINEKEEKLVNYYKEAKFHNLLVHDTENYFDTTKLEDFYEIFYQISIINCIQNSGFREIYFIGKVENKLKYFPLKGYHFYAAFYQFDSFYKKRMESEYGLLEFVNDFIICLFIDGFKRFKIHLGDKFIVMSFGDLSIKLDFEDIKQSFIMFNRDLDYSDGKEIEEFAKNLDKKYELYYEFKKYRNENSFHTNFSFDANA